MLRSKGSRNQTRKLCRFLIKRADSMLIHGSTKIIDPQQKMTHHKGIKRSFGRSAGKIYPIGRRGQPTCNQCKIL